MQPSTSRLKVFRDVTWYAISNLLNIILGATRGFIVTRWLGPTNLGSLAFVRLVVGWGTNANFGVLGGLSREIPRFRGTGNREQVERTEYLGLTLVLLMSVTVSIGLLVYSFFFETATVSPFAWRIAALTIPLQTFITYFHRVYRGEDRFMLVSRLTAISGSISLAMLPLILFLGLDGALYAEALFAMIMLAVTVWLGKPGLKLYLSKAATLSLLKVGLPIWGVGLVYLLFSTVDQWVVVSFIGTTALGYYGIVTMSWEMMGLVPTVITDVMYPKYVEMHARDRDTFKLTGYFRLPIVSVAFYSSLAIGVLYFTLPLFVEIFLPQFKPGIAAARIAIFRVFFGTIMSMPMIFLHATNRQTKYMISMIGASLLNISLNYLFMGRLGLGINGAALATTSSFAIYSLALITFAQHFHFWTAMERLKFYLEVYLPLAFTLVMVLVLGNLALPEGLNPLPRIQNVDVNLPVLQVIIFLLTSVPLIIVFNKRLDLLTSLLPSFLTKGKK